MSKKTLIDEWRYVIALLRRNDGDAASRYVEDDDDAFVERRSAMHSNFNQSWAERTNEIEAWSAD